METQTPYAYQAETRKRLAPSPDDPTAKRTICFECSEPFYQRFRQYKDCCPDCAATRHAMSIVQMREKRGYMYERWVRNRYYTALAEMRRLGLSPEVDQ